MVFFFFLGERIVEENIIEVLVKNKMFIFRRVTKRLFLEENEMFVPRRMAKRSFSEENRISRSEEYVSVHETEKTLPNVNSTPGGSP